MLNNERIYNIDNFYIGEICIVEKIGNSLNNNTDTFKPYRTVLNLKSNGALGISLKKDINWEKREKYYKVLTIFYKNGNEFICLHDGNIYSPMPNTLYNLSSLLPKYSYNIPTKITIKTALSLFNILFNKSLSLEKIYNNDKYNIEDFFIGTLALYTGFIPKDKKNEPQDVNLAIKYILSNNSHNICLTSKSTNGNLLNDQIVVPGRHQHKYYKSLFLKVPDGMYSVNGFITLNKSLSGNIFEKTPTIAESYYKQLIPITEKIKIPSKKISIPKVLEKIKIINI